MSNVRLFKVSIVPEVIGKRYLKDPVVSNLPSADCEENTATIEDILFLLLSKNKRKLVEDMDRYERMATIKKEKAGDR